MAIGEPQAAVWTDGDAPREVASAQSGAELVIVPLGVIRPIAGVTTIGEPQVTVRACEQHLWEAACVEANAEFDVPSRKAG